MSESWSWRERLAQRVPVQAIDRVPSGSPIRYHLRAVEPLTRTVVAALSLTRRHVPMLRAKRLVERLMVGRDATVEVPMVEDAAALEAELRECGIAATRLGPAPEVDARAVREKLGLTQEEFAWRFGLDVAALRNWEQGRTMPEAAVRSFLQVIEHDPDAVEQALAASG